VFDSVVKICEWDIKNIASSHGVFKQNVDGNKILLDHWRPVLSYKNEKNKKKE